MSFYDSRNYIFAPNCKLFAQYCAQDQNAYGLTAKKTTSASFNNTSLVNKNKKQKTKQNKYKSA